MTAPTVVDPHGEVWAVEARTASGFVWATHLASGYRTLLLPEDLGL